jgi:hypothetical protein
MLEINRGQRVSDSLGLDIASAAAEMSYAKSSKYVVGGELSRQAVMHKVRNSKPKDKNISVKRSVKALHVDADEAHITLTNGKKGIVPLVSVYEGIERLGKRHYCKNIFHISEYGLSGTALWQKVLDEIDSHYDLDDTVIYLHGDGAAWIHTGIEWLPRCIFVLDKYHRNKAIKAMCSGLGDSESRDITETYICKSLLDGDDKLFLTIVQSLPDGGRQTMGYIKYLWNHRKGISICQTDPEANNGGCTEPHVSHILSSRLSSRPCAWSKSTLKRLAPILAHREELEIREKSVHSLEPVFKKAIAKANKQFKPQHTLGAVAPEAVGNLTAIAIGKVNPTYLTLKFYAN